MPTSKMQEEGERVRGLQAVYACGRRRETRKHLGATVAEYQAKKAPPSQPRTMVVGWWMLRRKKNNEGAVKGRD